MSTLEQYASRFKSATLNRKNGILEVRLHTNGGPFRWSLEAHSELPELFGEIGRDNENRVIILTGTGNEFSGPQATPASTLFVEPPSLALINKIHWEGRQLLMNLLDIEVPVIAAVNGPAWRHSEIPLLSDIVLADEHAAFQDSVHFPSELVPGDGMHIVYPMLLGVNRARYFLLTGQIIRAEEAKQLGLIAEILPPDKLLARAWELAEDFTKKPRLVLRYTRLMLTENIKRQMRDLLGYGLALEGLAMLDRNEGK